MKRITLLLGIFLIGAMLFACAPKSIPLEKPEEPAAVVTKTDWEAEWERTIREAKKEGRVVVYGGSTVGELKVHATKLIKDKFGLSLEVLTGRGADLIAKMVAERRQGLFLQDLYASGAGSIYDTLKPRGFLDPLEPLLVLPEVVDPNAWQGGKLPWGDMEKRYVFFWPAYPDPSVAINTNLVKPNEITSFKDLLNPKWKGKIVINDPTVAGMGFSHFTALLYNKFVDLDFFEELVRKQNLTVIDDQHLQITWLAKEKFPILLFPSPGRMAEYKKAGAPISQITTDEGVLLGSAGGGLVLMKNAPHPNAAKLLVNWFLSKEGQYLIQGLVDKPSARVDVPTDNVDPILVRKPGLKYFPKPEDGEEFELSGEREKYRELARQTFGSLIGR